MIAELELVDKVSTSDLAVLLGDARKNSFARTRYGIKGPLFKLDLVREQRHIRFPWIHNRRPVFFHSLKVILSMNQTAVPSCCLSRAVL